MKNGSPKYRNRFLLLASFVFYAWGEPSYVALMLAQSLVGWASGLLIERWRGKAAAKKTVAATVVIIIGVLVFFKYTNFFISNINLIPGVNLGLLRLVMPIGISFYSFQILSYPFDLYRGKTQVQKNYLDFATYVTFFPQLIAGPIVRYSDIAEALSKREHSLAKFAQGVRRFVLGLGKKILIANVLGELVETLKNSNERTVLAVWLYAVAFALQIYFDFSGYSDMAIGLGKIFGFDFMENFNYPYIADSITEFWRRWHISLSGWFRDYVYIPLGGNRVSVPRNVFNIFVVWLLTGFWHGADWNFIFWGLYFAILLILEKFALKKPLKTLPVFLTHAYVLLTVLISWVFFDTANIGLAFSKIALMFGAGAQGIAGADSLYYLRSFALPLIIGAIGATRFPALVSEKLGRKFKEIFGVLEPLAVGALLVAVTAYLVDGSFNPFIYFRF
jgi:alginate O-acetyltransferase complex protein AlgI